MNVSRKYLTLCVVIGSILVFSLKDTLNLVHSVLHAIPNPFHSHSYLPHTHGKAGYSSANLANHRYQVQPPTHTHSHDAMDHLSYRTKKDLTHSSDKEEVKTSSQVMWDIHALYALQLINRYQLKASIRFDTHEPVLSMEFYPPSPPPEYHYISLHGVVL